MGLKNRFFDGEMLKVLVSPGRWRLISSYAPPDAAPLRRVGGPRSRWAGAHTHGHPNPEFLVVLTGSGAYGHKGTVYPCSPGTVFFFDSFEEHDLGYPRTTPDADHLWISILEEQLFAFIISLRRGAIRGRQRVRCVLSPKREGIAPLAFLRNEPEGLPPEWRRARILAALHAIVLKVVTKGFEAEQDQPDREAFHRQVIEAVQQHIRETSGRDLNLDGLARIAGYSKFHFLRLFQRHTGQTVLDYINRCRIEKAREMLAEGRRHKEIGAALGFSCPAAFSRWYRGRR
jgi:AraC-like DNA-binding protein